MCSDNATLTPTLSCCIYSVFLTIKRQHRQRVLQHLCILKKPYWRGSMCSYLLQGPQLSQQPLPLIQEVI